MTDHSEAEVLGIASVLVAGFTFKRAYTPKAGETGVIYFDSTGTKAFLKTQNGETHELEILPSQHVTREPLIEDLARAEPNRAHTA